MRNIVFVPLVVNASDRLYEHFIRLFFLHAHREAHVLANTLTEESDQFRFLLAACLAHLKGSVGLKRKGKLDFLVIIVYTERIYNACLTQTLLTREYVLTHIIYSLHL
jgi:hypothetical protein